MAVNRSHPASQAPLSKRAARTRLRERLFHDMLQEFQPGRAPDFPHEAALAATEPGRRRMPRKAAWSPERPPGPAQDAAWIALSDPATLKVLVERRLESLCPSPERPPHRLHGAMRHALLAPGKRMRPLLTLLAARQCGLRGLAALDAACAVEMVHAASLVLDDMPCMDDAQLRRGQPTTHLAYGEDVAMLAAVGLLNHAYATIAGCEVLESRVKAALVELFAATVGPQGLLGGQEFDLRDRAAAADPETIARFDHAKTGVLMAAAVEAGAIVAGADAATREALRAFAGHLGAAFQTLDDMIDALATPQTAFKDVGKDRGRASILSLYGEEGARRQVRDHVDAACGELARAGCGAEPLAGFARAAFARLGP